MNAGWLLLGLLSVAFIGSNVARGRGVRGFGLPSGSEWILTGIALGFLGIVRQRDLSMLSPVVAAGLGWVAMAIGMRCTVCLHPNLQEEVRAPRKALAIGALFALVTAGVIAAIADVLLMHFADFSPKLRLGTSCWIGCALSGSARQLVDWAQERHGARGATTDRIEAILGGGEIVALCGTAPLSVLVLSDSALREDLLWRAVLPLVLALLLGLVALWLLHFELRVAETWGILLGVMLLSVGLSMRAGSSIVAAGFLLGWLLGRDQRAGPELRRLSHPAEGAVLLPLLVIAGASLRLWQVGDLWWLIAVVVCTRLVTKLLLARLSRTFVVGTPVPTSALGMCLASSGEIACLVALEFTLSMPGQLAQLVLGSAITASLLGEFFGALGMRRTLQAANELAATAATTDGPRHGAADTTGWA